MKPTTPAYDCMTRMLGPVTEPSPRAVSTPLPRCSTRAAPKSTTKRPPITASRATEFVRGETCGAMTEKSDEMISTDPAKDSCRVTKLIPKR
jgi:hypothetical protein